MLEGAPGPAGTTFRSVHIHPALMAMGRSGARSSSDRVQTSYPSWQEWKGSPTCHRLCWTGNCDLTQRGTRHIVSHGSACPPSDYYRAIAGPRAGIYPTLHSSVLADVLVCVSAHLQAKQSLVQLQGELAGRRQQLCGVLQKARPIAMANQQASHLVLMLTHPGPGPG